jgi:hypothetical protein
VKSAEARTANVITANTDWTEWRARPTGVPGLPGTSFTRTPWGCSTRTPGSTSIGWTGGWLISLPEWPKFVKYASSIHKLQARS